MTQQEIDIRVRDDGDIGYSEALKAATARASKRLKSPVELVRKIHHTNTYPQTLEENAGEITFTFRRYSSRHSFHAL